MAEIAINLDVALEQFKLRKAANEKKERMDNSRLPAGAPMYFYCRFCGEHTATLPEGYLGRPCTICVPCEVLHQHGLLPLRA